MKNLFTFPGGIKLKANKHGSSSQAVQKAALSHRLILPLQQNIGSAAKAIVNVGDQVYKGQIIARDIDEISVPVHAPTSGIISSIEKHPIPHPSGLWAKCIIITTDGEDKSRRAGNRCINYLEKTPEEIRIGIHNAGIVGLGGAGFPSAIKLNIKDTRIDTLIINGAECEPYITCDDSLMQQHALQIVEGAKILKHAVQAKACIIAIENNKPEAIARIKQAVVEREADDIEVRKIPTVYPTGGEKQLIQTLTGKEVPQQQIPLTVNIVCLNVATAYAVYNAIRHGEPLISRFVTIAGSVAKARNLDALIGTPMTDLIKQCGGNPASLSRIIMGGPMMGYAMRDHKVPMIKTTNCILANSVVADVPMPSRLNQSLPCIRCGKCAEACPVNLLPQQLYWHAKSKDLDKVQDYNLFDCIECGCCDYVCPSHIPLVQYYRFAKSTIWNKEREKELADRSRLRHDFRLARIEREKAAKAA
ncbi:MAG: electron transport complex subunit RsxC, partial [Thiohalomonadales bacterium]